MSNRHTLNKIPARNGHLLKQYCVHDERCIEIRENGDHVIARGPKGSVVFPDREMGTGLWHVVLKSLIAIGLGVLALLIFIH